MKLPRSGEFKPVLFAFCLFSLVWVGCLLFAGGFTTTIRAGMAFLDWPLSNGSLNPVGWTENADQLAEHSHRLLGMKVGCLSLIACLWVYLRDERSWVRTLGRLLVWVVILQGVLGGARVRLDQLNTLADSNLWGQAFAVMHALGAQITLCLWVALALAQSPSWMRSVKVKPPQKLLILGYSCVAGLMIQVLLGALMRQNDAGLAMPTFPLTPQGHLWPSLWNLQTTLHFSHRAWACVVTIAVLVFLFKFMKCHTLSRGWGWLVGTVFVVINFQWMLGVLILSTLRNPYVTTLHMLGGAFMLASIWALSFLTSRFFLQNS